MTKRQGFMIGAILLATPIGLLATPIPQQSPLQRLGELALLNDQPTSAGGVAGDIGSQSPIERETRRSVVVAATVPSTTAQPSSMDDPAISPVVNGSLVPPSHTGSDQQQQQQQARDTVYRLSDLNRNPELRNGQAMAPIMERLYPRELQDLGLGGTVMMEFVIGRDGVADSSSVRVLETPWANLGEASIYAVKAFQFQPGMIDGQPVRVLIQMPITWRPRERSAQP